MGVGYENLLCMTCGLGLVQQTNEHRDRDASQQGERKLDAVVGMKLHLGQEATPGDAEKGSGASFMTALP